MSDDLIQFIPQRRCRTALPAIASILAVVIGVAAAGPVLLAPSPAEAQSAELLASLPNDQQRIGCRAVFANTNLQPASLPNRQQMRGGIACLTEASKTVIPSPTQSTTTRINCYSSRFSGVTCYAN